ncbi:MAG: hypothetical protein M1834_007907 [Cirrosporium novae-zelandiae]|nr:MAG: hypothetical protein M1834_007907 [Cirrosporium novae-zelandiae]
MGPLCSSQSTYTHEGKPLPYVNPGSIEPHRPTAYYDHESRFPSSQTFNTRAPRDYTWMKQLGETQHLSFKDSLNFLDSEQNPIFNPSSTGSSYQLVDYALHKNPPILYSQDTYNEISTSREAILRTKPQYISMSDSAQEEQGGEEASSSRPYKGDIVDEIETNSHKVDQICFGMIAHLDMERVKPDSPILINMDVDVTNQDVLSKDTNPVRLGVLTDGVVDVLNTLKARACIHLQMYCSSRKDEPQTINIPRKKPRTCAYKITLCVNLYGPSQLFDNVEDFLQGCGVYLQDPQNCDRRVPYRNPHCMWTLGDTKFTSDLRNNTAPSIIESINKYVDPLAEFETGQSLPETPAPSAIKTILYPHQRQALTFMTQRELPCNPQDHHPNRIPEYVFIDSS